MARVKKNKKNTQENEGNCFDSSSYKRVKKEMRIDRLSALPDGILVHILSFLSLKESAVTSVLSKKWEFIWTELPRLEFKEESFCFWKRVEFAKMVNRTLLNRTTIHLQKFEFCFWYDQCFASDVDSWLDFAIKNKVEEVGLMLLGQEKDEDEEDNSERYDLPETMYSNSSLTWFSVRGCDFDSLTKIEWPSLTWLSINESELPQHVVENILLGCPVLHTLYLIECWGFSCLDVKSHNLCMLKVHDHICMLKRHAHEYEGGKPLLEISAPYVHTLDILFNTCGGKLVLRNIESLVRAKINFTNYWPRGMEFTSITKELFEITLHVEELELGREYFKALSELVVNDWNLPVSRRKCLTVHTLSGDDHNISCIYALLRFSPDLEMFVIDGYDKHEVTNWSLDEAPGDLECDLLLLKIVKLIEFAHLYFGGEPMLKVAQSILKRATSLEEMTVTLRNKERDDYIKICQTLLSSSRSSEKAVIRIL